MCCGCGKAALPEMVPLPDPGETAYILVQDDDSFESFETLDEARAAKADAGGGRIKIVRTPAA